MPKTWWFHYFVVSLQTSSTNVAAMLQEIERYKPYYINPKIITRMNKAELVAAVAAKAEVSKAEAAKVIDAALEAAVEALKNGESVQLVGYATLSVAQKAERKGINPATKEAIVIPAKKVVKFKAGAKLAL